MSLGLAALVIVVSVVCAVGALLLVRKRAPVGGFFTDTDRAAGIFGFIGTAFSVLLAFVIFLALEDYLNARAEARHEADSVLQQFELAELFPSPGKDLLQSQLVCYGRGVIGDEWNLMQSGRRSAVVDGWTTAIEKTLDGVSTTGQKETIAFDKFFDETSAREAGRRGRLQEAGGAIPAPALLILLLGAGCILGYLLFFADSGEPALVQAFQVGTVTLLVVSSLVLVNFLDHPYHPGKGSIEPASMRFAVQTMERDLPGSVTLPCDGVGNHS
jgi:hypothetical protein